MRRIDQTTKRWLRNAVFAGYACCKLQVGDVESAARAFSAAQKASAAHNDPSLPPRAASALLQVRVRAGEKGRGLSLGEKAVKPLASA